MFRARYFVIQRAETLYLGRFLAIGPDDSRTGQILLRVRRES